MPNRDGSLSTPAPPSHIYTYAQDASAQAAPVQGARAPTAAQASDSASDLRMQQYHELLRRRREVLFQQLHAALPAQHKALLESSCNAVFNVHPPQMRRCPPPTRLLRRASHVAAPRALTSGVPSAVSLSNLDGRLRRDAQMPDCLGNDSMQGSICLHDADAMPALRPDPRGALQGLRLQPIRQPLQAQARVTAEHAARRRHTLFLLNPPSYWRHPPWHGALD